MTHERVAAALADRYRIDRFLHEIETTAGLRHPHILPLYDSGNAGGFLYYVMPYVEGESLRDRLDREQQLSIDDALTIAGEVADAIGYAHDRGVVHRDIKPENILLEGGHAVVADFGIARARIPRSAPPGRPSRWPTPWGSSTARSRPTPPGKPPSVPRIAPSPSTHPWATP